MLITEFYATLPHFNDVPAQQQKSSMDQYFPFLFTKLKSTYFPGLFAKSKYVSFLKYRTFADSRYDDCPQ